MPRYACRTCIPTIKDSCVAACAPRTGRTLLRNLGLIATAVVALLAIAAMADPALADPPDPPPSAERRLELVRFVRQECGFCHGLKLTGGLGSPLTAHALAGKPRESLESTILYGRPGTAMPGWMPHLSESDAAWIVTMLLKGFPE